MDWQNKYNKSLLFVPETKQLRIQLVSPKYFLNSVSYEQSIQLRTAYNIHKQIYVKRKRKLLPITPTQHYSLHLLLENNLNLHLAQRLEHEQAEKYLSFLKK
jgi:hypothetical protein